MNPSLDIKAYQSNVITDPYFDLDYFGSFDIIINALDNIGIPLYFYFANNNHI